ncbi:MAG: peptidylprolyl isomerase [Candidatus Zixiibacteriota bacterium]
MNRYRPVTLVTLLLLAVGLSTGCGRNKGAVLAVVGDHEITDQEFNEFFRVRAPFLTAQEEFEARMKVLDTAIATLLLIQAAYEKGIDTLEELARVVLANRDKFLVDVLIQRQVEDKASPTEAELKEFHRRLEYKVKASHILVDHPDTAQMMLERIRDGENFEKLAYQYSKDPSAKRNKGDLGFFTWGMMVDEFQQAAFSMEPGEVSPPVKSRYGYHIIKLVDKLPNEERVDYEAMKPALEEAVRTSKRTRIGEKYFDEIRERYRVTVDTATCNYLLHKREMIYPPMLLKSLPRNDFDPEQLDRNEKELVLATWDGGQITVIDYLTLAGRAVPQRYRPDFDSYDSLGVIIFRLKINDIMVVEAHRHGTDNDPEFLRKMKFFKELAMAEIMKSDSIPMPPPPDEAMIRLYYADNREQFTVPAKVHIHEILLSDELKAQKLAKGLNSFQEFKKAAERWTERSGKRIGGGDLGYVLENQFNMSAHFEAAWKTPVGGIAGPIQVDDKYAVIYVVDKIDTELKDFLGQKRDIVKILIDKQKQEALDRWVEDRRQATPVTIDEDAVRAMVDHSQYASADTTAATN